MIGEGGGGGGKRRIPDDITIRIPVILDGREITEIVQKRLLSGTYSMR
jgi:hypothetical protein